MQRYLSIDKDKVCEKTVKFQQLDNEFCGTIKFNQNGELKDLSSVIPKEASEENILVDREYLKENDSDFIGTFNSLEELEAYEGKVDKNDYAFVVEVDSSTGKRSYSRYVYTSEKVWKFQYKIDTGAQIIPTKTSELENDSGYITNDDIPTKVSELENDSGYITSTDIPTKLSELEDDVKLGEHLSQIDSEISNLSSALDDKQDALSDVQLQNIDAVPGKADEFTKWNFEGDVGGYDDLRINIEDDVLYFAYVLFNGDEQLSTYTGPSKNETSVRFSVNDKRITATRKRVLRTGDSIDSQVFKEAAQIAKEKIDQAETMEDIQSALSNFLSKFN